MRRINERLFECGQDWLGEGRLEQPGGLPVNDRKGGKVRRSVRLAGNCHDEQVWAVGVVSGAGDDYGRPFFALLLIGEWERYEDNLAKLENGFGGHLRKVVELQRVVRRVGIVVPDGGEAGYGSLSCGLHQCAVILTAAQKIHEVGHFCEARRRQLQDFLDQQMFGGVHGYLSEGTGAMDYTESRRLYKISGSKNYSKPIWFH